MPSLTTYVPGSIMKKSLILFDLDDTLLSNQMSTFLPAYLKALSKALIEYISPDRMVSTLLAATQTLVEKTTPLKTLEETFDQCFYPGIDIPKADLQPIIDQFYIEDFPKLRNLTQPRPEAIRMIETALEMGCDIAIATNPLFPKTATRQRLSWANLDHHRYPFVLVSTYESFHFCKPHPAYYAEILAQLGWQHSHVVMIGNEWEDDISPAETLGIPAYWLTDENQSGTRMRLSASSCGSLTNAVGWIQSRLADPGDPPSYQPIPAIMAVLRSTPAALETLLKRIDTHLWSEIPINNKYSISEAVQSLSHIDQETSLTLQNIPIQSAQPEAPLSVNRQNTERYDHPFEEDNPLSSFFESRLEVLHQLEQLSSDQWRDKIRHPIFGEDTLQKITEYIAATDRTVLQDIYLVLNSDILT